MRNIDIIEKLNYDYLKIVGSIEYKNALKKGCLRVNNFKDLFFKINRKIHLHGINDVGVNYNFSNNDCKLMSTFDISNKKVVIYSSIVGNYDSLQEPLFFSDNIDYIMFTDLPIKSQKWKINKIPKKILELDNPILINRYIKFHPFELFGNKYDYSIYMDGNIMVVSDLSEMVALINKKYGIAFHNHYARDCVYDEGKYCIYNKKGNKKAIEELLEQYRKENFPKKYGLVEAPIIISDLKSDISKEIQKDTYELLVKSNTFRDQLCIPYVLWKKNILPIEVSSLGKNIHYNFKVRSIKHI